MKPHVSIIIPAWNEEQRIGITLDALRQALPGSTELIVIDDGSRDRTADMAAPWADQVHRLPRNSGKGAAMDIGWRLSRGEYVMFLDADLQQSAANTLRLLDPLERGEADMTIARFPPGPGGGFGWVKGMAKAGIHRLSGFRATEPLSGQRALRRELLERIGTLSARFGVEVGLTIDAARAGFRIMEVELPLTHRETGRDWRGFYHRGKQFAAVAGTLSGKWAKRR